MEMVLAHRCADKRGPAFAVSQRRPDHLGPHAGPHLPVLIEHRAVQVQAAQGVWVVGPEDLYAPIAGQVHTQLGLVDLRAGELARQVLE